MKDLWWQTLRTRGGKRGGPVVANVEDPGWPISRTGDGRFRESMVANVKDPRRPMSRTVVANIAVRGGQRCRGPLWLVPGTLDAGIEGAGC
jgi:hypothetical protein